MSVVADVFQRSDDEDETPNDVPPVSLLLKREQSVKSWRARLESPSKKSVTASVSSPLPVAALTFDAESANYERVLRAAARERASTARPSASDASVKSDDDDSSSDDQHLHRTAAQRRRAQANGAAPAVDSASHALRAADAQSAVALNRARVPAPIPLADTNGLVGAVQYATFVAASAKRTHDSVTRNRLRLPTPTLALPPAATDAAPEPALAAAYQFRQTFTARDDIPAAPLPPPDSEAETAEITRSHLNRSGSAAVGVTILPPHYQTQYDQIVRAEQELKRSQQSAEAMIRQLQTPQSQSQFQFPPAAAGYAGAEAAATVEPELRRYVPITHSDLKRMRLPQPQQPHPPASYQPQAAYRPVNASFPVAEGTYYAETAYPPQPATEPPQPVQYRELSPSLIRQPPQHEPAPQYSYPHQFYSQTPQPQPHPQSHAQQQQRWTHAEPPRFDDLRGRSVTPPAPPRARGRRGRAEVAPALTKMSMHDRTDGENVSRALCAVAEQLYRETLKHRMMRGWREAMDNRRRVRRHFHAWSAFVNGGERQRRPQPLAVPQSAPSDPPLIVSAVVSSNRSADSKRSAAAATPVPVASRNGSGGDGRLEMSGSGDGAFVPTLRAKPPQTNAEASTASVALEPSTPLAAPPQRPAIAVAAFADHSDRPPALTAAIADSSDIGSVARAYRRNTDKWIVRRALEWWRTRTTDRMLMRRTGARGIELARRQVTALVRQSWVQWRTAVADRARAARAERLRLFEIAFAQEQAIEARNERIRNAIKAFQNRYNGLIRDVFTGWRTVVRSLTESGRLIERKTRKRNRAEWLVQWRRAAIAHTFDRHRFSRLVWKRWRAAQHALAVAVLTKSFQRWKLITIRHTRVIKFEIRATASRRRRTIQSAYAQWRTIYGDRKSVRMHRIAEQFARTATLQRVIRVQWRPFAIAVRQSKAHHSAATAFRVQTAKLNALSVLAFSRDRSKARRSRNERAAVHRLSRSVRHWRRLIARHRQYSDDARTAIHADQLRVLRAVWNDWRAGQARGVEMNEQAVEQYHTTYRRTHIRRAISAWRERIANECRSIEDRTPARHRRLFVFKQGWSALRQHATQMKELRSARAAAFGMNRKRLLTLAVFHWRRCTPFAAGAGSRFGDEQSGESGRDQPSTSSYPYHGRGLRRSAFDRLRVFSRHALVQSTTEFSTPLRSGYGVAVAADEPAVPDPAASRRRITAATPAVAGQTPLAAATAAVALATSDLESLLVSTQSAPASYMHRIISSDSMPPPASPSALDRQPPILAVQRHAHPAPHLLQPYAHLNGATAVVADASDVLNVGDPSHLTSPDRKLPSVGLAHSLVRFDASDTATENMRIAELHYRHAFLRRLFRPWRVRSHLHARGVRAVLWLQRRALSRSFQLWRIRLKRLLDLSGLLFRVRLRTQRSVFDAWKGQSSNRRRPHPNPLEPQRPANANPVSRPVSVTSRIKVTLKSS